MIQNQIFQDNLALKSLGNELKNTLETTKELHKEFRVVARKVNSAVKNHTALDPKVRSENIKLTKELKESTTKITVLSSSIDEMIRLKHFHEKLAGIEVLAMTCENYQSIKDALENLKKESKELTDSKEFEQINRSSKANLEELTKEIADIKVWLSTNKVVTEDLELANNIMNKALSVIDKIETANTPTSSIFSFKRWIG